MLAPTGRRAPASTDPAPRSLVAALLQVQRSAGNRAAARLAEALAGGPGPVAAPDPVGGAVQRMVIWSGLGGTNNPFKPAEDRAAGNTTLGYTPPTINNARADTLQGARNALQGPTVANHGGQWHVVPPVNDVGFEQDLMVAGPYRYATTRNKAYLATEGHPVLVKWWEQDPTGAATVEVVGHGGDHAKLTEQVKAHEDRHGADHRAVVERFLEPWDERLSQVKPIEGTLPQQLALAQVEMEAGRDASSMATQLDREWTEASRRFHAAAEGKTTVAEPTVAGNTVTIKITQP